ncbi:Subtilisin inhibitor-like [Salinibacterium sp. NYA9b]
MSMMRTSHRISIALIAAVAAATLAGCTSEGPRTIAQPDLPPVETAQRAEEQADAALERLLELYPDVEVPEASFVRFVTIEELPIARADCLSSHGFDVTVEDGGIGWEETEDFDKEKFYAVQYLCEIKYPLDPKFG